MGKSSDLAGLITSALTSCETSDIKKLRKQVLLGLQTDENDKDAKKKFKKAVKSLESEGFLTLDSEGTVSIVQDEKDKKKKKKSKSDKKDKKKRKQSEDGAEDSSKRPKTEIDLEGGEEENNVGDASTEQETKKKKKPCKGNPNAVTRLFLGNLPFAVDETSLREFFLPAVLTHIKWITDKETGKFYGSAFVEMATCRDAAIGTTEKNGENLMGRPIRINYAPSREGDVWPPKTKEVTGNKGQAGGSGLKAMSEKPENCVKLFVGNLSFDIDDDTIMKFFANVDAEVKAVRWLHHRDSGDFKGCGYVEFWNSEACEKGATLNGKTLMGRPIRIDWTD